MKRFDKIYVMMRKGGGFKKKFNVTVRSLT